MHESLEKKIELRVSCFLSMVAKFEYHWIYTLEQAQQVDILFFTVLEIHGTFFLPCFFSSRFLFVIRGWGNCSGPPRTELKWASSTCLVDWAAMIDFCVVVRPRPPCPRPFSSRPLPKRCPVFWPSGWPVYLTHLVLLASSAKLSTWPPDCMKLWVRTSEPSSPPKTERERKKGRKNSR